MKKVKIVTGRYHNQLESEINKYMQKEGWELKTAYSDGQLHYAVLEKEESK